MKLYLVRHGQSTWNLENKFTGWTDVALSENGIAEANAAGKLLKNVPEQIDIAFTSYLKRAKDTLTLICNHLSYTFPIYEYWELNERHYGALQGLNKAETAKKYGDEQVHIWRRSASTRPPLLEPTDTRNPAYDPLYKDISEPLPLGESLADTRVRVEKCWLQDILPKCNHDSVVLISAHGNSLRALIQYLDNLSADEVMKLEIPTGKPIVYELDQTFKPIKHYNL